jgi:nucleotidyltransferase AbiEii toxin of type IV toxin-antitoxin system
MLDGDHRALVEAVLPVCSRYGLAVAGGYAVKAHGLVERPSEDIDFATGAAAPVGEIVAELAAAYRVAGFTVQVLDADGRKGHLLVTFPLGGTYRVDVLKEPLNHPVVWMEFGPVIALADAVALKMGALHDRALPRDVLDAHGASSHFTRTELITACRAALDEEFSLEMLRDQLAFASTYPDEAFSRYGAKPELIAEVKAWALDWSTEIGLDMAESESWSDDEGDQDAAWDE